MEGWKLNSASRLLEIFWGQDPLIWEMRDELALLLLGGDSLHHVPTDPPETSLPGRSLVGAEAGSPKGGGFSVGFELGMSSLLRISHAAFLRARTLLQHRAELP